MTAPLLHRTQASGTSRVTKRGGTRGSQFKKPKLDLSSEVNIKELFAYRGGENAEGRGGAGQSIPVQHVRPHQQPMATTKRKGNHQTHLQSNQSKKLLIAADALKFLQDQATTFAHHYASIIEQEVDDALDSTTLTTGEPSSPMSFDAPALHEYWDLVATQSDLILGSAATAKVDALDTEYTDLCKSIHRVLKRHEHVMESLYKEYEANEASLQHQIIILEGELEVLSQQFVLDAKEAVEGMKEASAGFLDLLLRGGPTSSSDGSGEGSGDALKKTLLSILQL